MKSEEIRSFEGDLILDMLLLNVASITVQTTCPTSKEKLQCLSLTGQPFL